MVVRIFALMIQREREISVVPLQIYKPHKGKNYSHKECKLFLFHSFIIPEAITLKLIPHKNLYILNVSITQRCFAKQKPTREAKKNKIQVLTDTKLTYKYLLKTPLEGTQ